MNVVTHFHNFVYTAEGFFRDSVEAIGGYLHTLKLLVLASL